ncbi:MAG: sce7726 family protein [Rhodothermaceae bacterium]|nr:sce7726 family protein [Rhodothermaceae bacterium]MYD66829.1 sce7726 family protein [Rhodothermaceae bacterium]MYI78171.1 sce7726 family protein [Gammaproteobacteria bacterium]
MDHRPLRTLFDATHLRDLAALGYSPRLHSLARILKSETPKEVFVAAYEKLRVQYCVEYVIKNELLHWVREREKNSLIRTEYWTEGGRRADVVTIGDTSTAYEIKTRYDSPTRLKDQFKAYSKVFEHVVLVTQSGYTNKFYKHAPSYAGLYVLDRDGSIRVAEKPRRHAEDLSAYAMITHMRKAERVAFVKELDPEAKYVSSQYWKQSVEIAEAMTPEEMSTHFKYFQGQRERPVRHLDFISKLPRCFAAALYDYWLTVKELKALVGLMDHSVHR